MDNTEVVVSNVYGPYLDGDREVFWEELKIRRWSGGTADSWCIRGDFNGHIPFRKGVEVASPEG